MLIIYYFVLCGREAEGVFVETALSDDGMLASDHRPVVADIVIT